MKIFKKVVIDEDSEEILIPFWNADGYVSIQWGENESVDDIFKKYDIVLYDLFLDFYDIDNETLKYQYPYSVNIYEFKSKDCYLALRNEMTEFDDILHSVAIPYNHFNIYLFYKEMCMPFTSR